MRRGTRRAATANKAAESPGLDHGQQAIDSLLHLAEVAAALDTSAGATDGGGTALNDQDGLEHQHSERSRMANQVGYSANGSSAGQAASLHGNQALAHKDDTAATVTMLLQHLKDVTVEEPVTTTGQQSQNDSPMGTAAADNSMSYADRIATALAAATAAQQQQTALPSSEANRDQKLSKAAAASASAGGPLPALDANLLADVISKMEPSNAAALLKALGTWSSSAAGAPTAAGAGPEPTVRSAGETTAAGCSDTGDEASDSAGTGGGKSQQRWTDEEHIHLEALVEQHGIKNWGCWPAIADQFPGRTGKQCRERYLNHTSQLKKGDWQLHEEATIAKLHSKWGNKWTAIASHLPGRSDNCVKNHWNAMMRSKRPDLENVLWLYCQNLRQGMQPAAALTAMLNAIPDAEKARHGLDDAASESLCAAGISVADAAAAAAAIFGPSSSRARATSSATLGGAAQQYTLVDAAGPASVAEAAAGVEHGDAHPAALQSTVPAGPGISQPPSDPVAAAASVVLAAVAAAARQGELQTDAEALAAAATAVARAANGRGDSMAAPEASFSPAFKAVATSGLSAGGGSPAPPTADLPLLQAVLAPAVQQGGGQEPQHQQWQQFQSLPASTDTGLSPVMQFLNQALHQQQQQQETYSNKQLVVEQRHQPGAALLQQQLLTQHLPPARFTEPLLVEAASKLQQASRQQQQQALPLQQQQQQALPLQQQQPQRDKQRPLLETQHYTPAGAGLQAVASAPAGTHHSSGTVLSQLLAAATDAAGAGKAPAAASSVTAAINMVRAYYGRSLVLDGSDSGYIPAEEYLMKLQASSIGAADSCQPQQQGRGQGGGRGRGGRGKSKAGSGRGPGTASRFPPAKIEERPGQSGLSALVHGMITSQPPQQAQDDSTHAEAGPEGPRLSSGGSEAAADLRAMLQLLKPNKNQQQQLDHKQQTIKHSRMSKLVVGALSTSALAATVAQKRLAARRSRQRVLEQMLLTEDPLLRPPAGDIMCWMQGEPAGSFPQGAAQAVSSEPTAPPAGTATTAGGRGGRPRQGVKRTAEQLSASAAIDALPVVDWRVTHPNTSGATGRPDVVLQPGPMGSAAPAANILGSDVATGHTPAPVTAAPAQLDLAKLASTAEGLKLLEGLKAVGILPEDLSLAPGVQLTVQLQVQAQAAQGAATATGRTTADASQAEARVGAGLVNGPSSGGGNQEAIVSEPADMEVDTAADQKKVPADAVQAQTAAATAPSTAVAQEPTSVAGVPSEEANDAGAAGVVAGEPTSCNETVRHTVSDYKVGSKRPISAILPVDALATAVAAAKRVLRSSPAWGDEQTAAR